MTFRKPVLLLSSGKEKKPNLVNPLEGQLFEKRLGGLNFTQIFSHPLFKIMRLITLLFYLQILISTFHNNYLVARCSF